MGMYIGIQIIKKENVNKYPQTVQKYLENFFESKIIFGIECYFAPYGDFNPTEQIDYEDKDYELTKEELQNCKILNENDDERYAFGWIEYEIPEKDKVEIRIV